MNLERQKLFFLMENGYLSKKFLGTTILGKTTLTQMKDKLESKKEN
jgi:hypothetical protein